MRPGLPVRPTGMVGLAIAFSGALGVAAARIHRTLALRGREGEIGVAYLPASP